jgi:protease II
MGAGHMGESGRFDRLKEYAMECAFVLHTFGMAQSEPGVVPVSH